MELFNYKRKYLNLLNKIKNLIKTISQEKEEDSKFQLDSKLAEDIIKLNLLRNLLKEDSNRYE